VQGHEDSLPRNRTLSELFRYCIAPAAAGTGAVEFTDCGAASTIFDDQHALLAGFFVHG